MKYNQYYKTAPERALDALDSMSLDSMRGMSDRPERALDALDSMSLDSMRGMSDRKLRLLVPLCEHWRDLGMGEIKKREMRAKK